MTFSRLTLGEPRLKSKLRGGSVATAAPCDEPLVYGTNILRDPGFENHLANVERGPATADFPGGLYIPGDSFSPGGSTPGSLYWHTDNITDTHYYDDNGWAVWSNNVGAFGTDPSPFISDANPRSGTYHWRVSYIEEQAWQGAETYPVPVGGRYCEEVSGRIQAYSGRCAEGDYVFTSCYAMVNEPINGPFFTAVFISFHDENSSKVGSDTYADNGNQTLSSWSLVQGDAVAPAGAYTVVVAYEIYADVTVTAGPLHLDIDDCVLEVQP